MRLWPRASTTRRCAPRPVGRAPPGDPRVRDAACARGPARQAGGRDGDRSAASPASRYGARTAALTAPPRSRAASDSSASSVPDRALRRLCGPPQPGVLLRQRVERGLLAPRPAAGPCAARRPGPAIPDRAVSVVARRSRAFSPSFAAADLFNAERSSRRHLPLTLSCSRNASCSRWRSWA